jgi:hypothetical protein
MQTHLLVSGLLVLWGGGVTYPQHVGRHPDAQPSHRLPLAAGGPAVARALAGEGGQGGDPRGDRPSLGSVRGPGAPPVHLLWVSEGPPPGQRIHDLEGRRDVLPRYRKDFPIGL